MIRKDLVYFFGLLIAFGIGAFIIYDSYDSAPPELNQISEPPFLLITGTAQDAGYPQAGCMKSCCVDAFQKPSNRRYPVSLSLIEPGNGWWLIEATPDIKFQLEDTRSFLTDESALFPNGIFLTHAHIGHYSGLMHFGREVMGAHNQKVYALPRMHTFLSNNGPWDQLVKIQNIQLEPIFFETPVQVSQVLTINPIKVPHRDEYSETAGFHIVGPSRSALFIPDIDKWNKWDQNIIEWIKKVDYALLDATFFFEDELPGRNMSEIPHPFVIETLELLSQLDKADKSKVIFIHLNHTNPLHNSKSDSYKKIIKAGFRVARQNQVLQL